jgi:hypothetical protein
MAMRERTARKSKPSKQEIEGGHWAIYHAGPQLLGLLAMLYDHRPGYDISGAWVGKRVGGALREMEAKGLVRIVPEITHSGNVMDPLPLFGAQLTALGRHSVKKAVEVLYAGDLGVAMCGGHVSWCLPAMVERAINTRTKRSSGRRWDI